MDRGAPRAPVGAFLGARGPQTPAARFEPGRGQ